GGNPGVLVHSSEQRPRLGVLRVDVEHGAVVLARAIDGVTGGCRQCQSLQADTFLAENPEILWIAVEAVVQMLQGKLVAFGPAQRLTGLCPGLRAKGGDGRLVGQYQKIADSPGPAGKLRASLPGIVLLPELTHIADAERLPVRFTQVGH